MWETELLIIKVAIIACLVAIVAACRWRGFDPDNELADAFSAFGRAYEEYIDSLWEG